MCKKTCCRIHVYNLQRGKNVPPKQVYNCNPAYSNESYIQEYTTCRTCYHSRLHTVTTLNTKNRKMPEKPLQQGGKPWSKAPGSSRKRSISYHELFAVACPLAWLKSKALMSNTDRMHWALAACCVLTIPLFLAGIHRFFHFDFNSVHWRHLNI